MQVALERSKQTRLELVLSWVESSPGALLWALSALYWIEIYGRITTKAIWYDEIFSLYVSRLGWADQLWPALKAGIDNQPPLFFLITRAMQMVFSDAVWAIRMPQAIAIFVVYAALFLLLRPRFGVLHTINTLLLLRLLGAQHYAAEARPYATLVAAVALALLCYAQLEDAAGRKYGWWLGGFLLSLALANGSHYYGAMALIPFGCAELVRGTRFGWRWQLWGAMAASLFPYLVLVDLHKALFAYKNGFSSKATISVFLNYWSDFTSPFTMRVFLLFLGAKLGMHFVAGARPAREPDYPFEKHEMVAIILLCALPVISLAVGMLVTGVFVLRYTLPAILGWAIFFGMCLWRETGWNRPVSLACFLFLFVCSFATSFTRLNGVQERPWDEVIATLEKTDGDVVVEYGLSYLELYHAAPAELKRRLVFLANGFDTQNVARMNTLELGLNRLRLFYPIRVADVEQYVAGHGSFHLLRFTSDPNGNKQVVTTVLADRRRPVILSKRLQNNELWRVASATYN